jgi:hypothetical protein
MELGGSNLWDACLISRVGQNHIYIQCIYGNFGRNIKYTVTYGVVYLWFLPTLLISRGVKPTFCCHIFTTDHPLHQLPWLFWFWKPLNKWRSLQRAKVSIPSGWQGVQVSMLFSTKSTNLGCRCPTWSFGPVNLYTEHFDKIWARALVACNVSFSLKLYWFQTKEVMCE